MIAAPPKKKTHINFMINPGSAGLGSPQLGHSLALEETYAPQLLQLAILHLLAR
jgi:hypothetical protein